MVIKVIWLFWSKTSKGCMDQSTPRCQIGELKRECGYYENSNYVVSYCFYLISFFRVKNSRA